jgi:hypothetical protein
VAYTPRGTSQHGYEPLGSSIAQRVSARHRDLEPDQSYSPGGTSQAAYEPLDMESIGARVHARHASAVTVDDVAARGAEESDFWLDRCDDEDEICMF